MVEFKSELSSRNEDLERIIAKLMEFPDLSLGSAFNFSGII
jgi:hypothetical protein